MYAAYRKRKFKNRHLNRLFERYIRIRKPVRQFVRKIMEKGHQKTTLMFVPHSEKKIFNIQISNFIIVFVSLILVFSIVFSVIALNDHESNQTRIRSLSNVSRHREGQILAFNDRARYTFQNFSRVTREMVRLSESLGIRNPEKIYLFTGKGGGDTAFLPERGTDARFGSSIVTKRIMQLETVNTNMARSAAQLERINAFLANLKEVTRYTPSIWPVAGGGFVTSRFGERDDPFTGMRKLHTGIDIAWWPGSPIKATASGTVRFVQNMGPYGLCVFMDHQFGFSTRYAHLQSARIKPGDTVQKGQIIASMGNSGRATGYHLHYEVLLDNRVIDPEPYMTGKF